MLLSNCGICGNSKSTFDKNQGLSIDYFKMNNIIDKFYWLETNLCQNCIWNS